MNGHVLISGDTDNAHMPKVPDTTTWFRPIPEEERPASPEPEWVIPPIDLPEAVNNWANAFAKAHQDPDENKLHNKINDIGSFIRWYCRRIGKKELNKARDLKPDIQQMSLPLDDLQVGGLINHKSIYTKRSGVSSDRIEQRTK
ncbi:hypothetical protein Tco_1076480 [Tanacetum coccineum]